MILVRQELCPQNHRCPTLSICPVGAISQNGFRAPTVDNEKCISCCKCTQSCAVFATLGCCDGERAPRGS
jgi:ferredoxin